MFPGVQNSYYVFDKTQIKVLPVTKYSVLLFVCFPFWNLENFYCKRWDCLLDGFGTLCSNNQQESFYTQSKWRIYGVRYLIYLMALYRAHIWNRIKDQVLDHRTITVKEKRKSTHFSSQCWCWSNINIPLNQCLHWELLCEDFLLSLFGPVNVTAYIKKMANDRAGYH